MPITNDFVTVQWDKHSFGVRMISLYPPIGPVPFDNHTYVPITYSRERVEVNSTNTPGYETKKKYGVLPNNPYFRSILKLGDGFFVAKRFEEPQAPYGTYRNDSETKPFAAYGWPAPIPVPDWNDLKNDLLGKVKGVNWSAPVAMAEASKTIDLVTTNVLRITSTMKALKQGKLGLAMDTLGIGQPPTPRKLKKFDTAYGTNPRGAASSAWLELQYGWKPLLFDVKNAAETLADRLHDPHSRRTTASVRKTISSTLKDQDVLIENSPRLKVDRHLFTKSSVKVSVTFEMDYASSAATAVGITNPALVVWELVPYSFVVDWFVPVGDFLNSLDSTFGKTFISGYVYEKSQHDLYFNATEREGYTEVTGNQKCTYSVKNRQRLLDFPEPELPSFSPKLSLTKMTSALALLQSAFGRR